MPTFTHGKSAAFKIDDSGGTLRDISNVLTDVAVSRSADVAEVSAFSNSSKAYVAGLKDATITISGSFDATVDGYLKGILGASGSFEFYPIGTTGGNPKASGECIMTSYDRTPDVGGAVTFSAAFQVSGDVTEGTA
tara:strand:+ start:5844 stop:6251 length:408 start_codon:yes stop_codon:yes gene_type:complete